LEGLYNIVPRVKKYVMEPNVFLGCLDGGIACSLNHYEYEHYPSTSLNQSNSAHGDYSIIQWGIAFLLCFGKAM
jgi:hypothetical protein